MHALPQAPSPKELTPVNRLAVIAGFLASAVCLCAGEPRIAEQSAAASRPSTQAAPTLASATASQPISESRLRPLNEVFEDIRARHGVPALVGAIVHADGVIAAGAAGVRRAGSPQEVTVDDQFHIGSCSKAMTATLIARLVERGRLRWETTIGEVFGEMEDSIRPEYATVTLEQLLTHRGGLPEDRRPGPGLLQLRTLTGPIEQQRLRMVELALSQPPAAPPGTQMIYSNQGYAVAAAMAEEVIGRPWEELIRDDLFTPLQMSSAGFGAPGTAFDPGQPRGHYHTPRGYEAVEPSAIADNPACLYPAGGIHLTILDWAKFALLHLRAACDELHAPYVDNGRAGTTPSDAEAPYLLPDTLRKLHAPPTGSTYAMGWALWQSEKDGRVLRHAGSNTLWFATISLAPQSKVAILVATNAGTEAAQRSCSEAEAALLELARPR